MRIEQARSTIAERHDDPLMRERLSEGLREHYGYDSTESYDLAVSLLTRLDRDLGGLKRRAEAIDLRMAAFNRLSQQRYRYQTELRGRRPEIIKAYCDAINTAHAAGGRVICVGTTSLRLIESAADEAGIVQPFADETAIFITPGYKFRAADGLMTNFHLPKSTLYMLVSAFAGLETMRAAYAHAIAEGYRFYSYGDASLLERNPRP